MPPNLHQESVNHLPDSLDLGVDACYHLQIQTHDGSDQHSVLQFFKKCAEACLGNVTRIYVVSQHLGDDDQPRVNGDAVEAIQQGSLYICYSPMVEPERQDAPDILQIISMVGLPCEAQEPLNTA